MKKLIVLTFLPFLLLGCKKSETPIVTDCDQIGVVDDARMRTAPRDDFSFVSAEIVDDCLEVIVQYGGGCGGATFELIAGDDVTDGVPPQRLMLISFEDKDDCEAWITDTLSFDITALQVDISNEVALTLDGIMRTPILYSY